MAPPPHGDMSARPDGNTGVSQLGNYSSLQNTVIGINTILLVLAILAIALRFWSRHIKGVRFMINDLFASLALLVLLGFFVSMMYGLCSGMGRKARDLSNPASQVPNLLKVCALRPLPSLPADRK